MYADSRNTLEPEAKRRAHRQSERPVGDKRDHHRRAGVLVAVVEDESADPIAYVRSLEAQPMFEQVAAEQGRKENEIRMTLTVRP